MNRFVKTAIAIISSATFAFCSLPYASATDSAASLDNIYDNGMLFRRNDTAVLTGTGRTGSEIKCELVDEDNNTVTTVYGQVDENGEFSVSFQAPEGSFKKYSISMSADNKEFRKLEDVVFGELWIASGQSNMDYGYGGCDTYDENFLGSEWTRFLYVNSYPTYNGDENNYPYEAMSKFEDNNCRWIKGGTENVVGVSAVAFFFAQKLCKDLNMPVGMLCSSLGGSSMASWLPREVIESDDVLKNEYMDKELLFGQSEWGKAKISPYYTATVNYNKKIYPLRNFKISGMIWYQGETDIILGINNGVYQRSLELLQNHYGELFGCDGSMPFVLTQLAPYEYNNELYSLRNFEMVKFCNGDDSSRALSTISDISLGFNIAGSIHPAAKQPVAERMAQCAEGLVYGLGGISTAAKMISYTIDGRDVFVNFSGVGDGLKVKGDRIYGFSLCNDGGVFVQADAEIIDKDTVRVYSDEVDSPTGVAYAFGQNCMRANIYSTDNGELVMPAAGFSTKEDGKKNYNWEMPAWADCDSDKVWLLSGSTKSGFYEPWTSKNSVVTITADDAYVGDGGLNVKSDSGILNRSFSVSPRWKYKDGAKNVKFGMNMFNWKNYSSVSVMVRNNGDNDIKLKSMRIYTSSATWYAPEVNGCGEGCTVIPADGQWHKLTFDLDKLYLLGNECGAVYSRAKLGSIEELKLCFDDGGKGADLSIDEFRFTGNAADGSKIDFNTSLKQADTPFEFVTALFVMALGAVINLFK